MVSAISHSLPFRGTTFFSFILLLTLSLTVILSSSTSKPSADFLQKRGALVQGRQEPNSSSSSFSSSSTPNRGRPSRGPSTTSTTTPAASTTSAIQTTSRQTTAVTSTPDETSTSSTSTTTSRSTSTTTSSTSTTTSSTPTVIFAPTDTPPLTTFVVPTTTFTADADPTDTSTAVPASAAGNGFWNNKGAVGATFSIVGLVGLGILVAGGTMAMRRRNRGAIDGDDFLDKYPNSNHGNDILDDNVSTHNVITPAAPDAYLDRTLHYGGDSINSNASGSYSSQQNANGFAQQPSSNQYNQMHQDANSSSQYSSNQYNQMHQDANSNPQQYNSSEYNQMHQGDPNSIQQPQVGQVQMQHMGQGNVFEHPPGLAYVPEQVQYNNQVAGSNQQYAPPAAFRDQAGRGSYQPSIDSFYGAYGAR